MARHGAETERRRARPRPPRRGAQDPACRCDVRWRLFTPTVYHVLRLDRVQAHAYIVQEAGVDLEKRVDLLPSKFRAEDHVLQARGEWQLLPHQPSIVPYSWEAMICQRCQSSRHSVFLLVNKGRLTNKTENFVQELHAYPPSVRLHGSHLRG